MPQPRLSDLRRFCQIDAWEEVTKGRRRPDHTRYRKVLDSGDVLRTKVSHGRGTIEDPSLWSHIWREQLGLESEDQFWAALDSGEPVPRATSTASPSGPSKPAWLETQLIYSAGVPEGEVAAMTESEARERWDEFCARPKLGGTE